MYHKAALSTPQDSGTSLDQNASWYNTNSACRVIMWAVSPLFTCLPSMICFTVAGT